jgi:hypothetical protein
VTGRAVDIASAVEQIERGQREHLALVLLALIGSGCSLERTVGSRDDDISTAAPPDLGGRPLASLTGSTGRLELQANSWDTAMAMGCPKRHLGVPVQAATETLGAQDRPATNQVDPQLLQRIDAPAFLACPGWV